jgi:hypothetical protein
VHRVSTKMATSLANTVSTRADSASRHMLQCRVHKNRLLDWTKSRCDNQLLLRHKHKYCLAKDELALEVSQSMDVGADHLARWCHPYPMVLSSFSGLGEEANLVYSCLMHTGTPFGTHLKEIFDVIKTDGFNKNNGTGAAMMDANALYQIKTLPYFRTMGYSVGTAYAHEGSGDTIASVMIGGISTVLNGEFPLHTGDLVMWYLTAAEKSMFTHDGKRSVATNGGGGAPLLNPMQLVNGEVPPFNYQQVRDFVRATNEAATITRNVRKPSILENSKNRYQQNLIGVDTQDTSAKNEIALIKPFFHRNSSDGDYERVFAKCVSPAGPFEMVDIMISRQSL